MMSIRDILGAKQTAWGSLPLTFDVDALIRETERAQREWGFGEDRRQLCLTSRPGAQEPLRDGEGNLLGRGAETDFTVFNREFEGTVFEDIYRTVPYRLGRVRLMALPPRSCYSFHQDSEPRLHIAIVTNPQAFLLLDAGGNNLKRLHLPADGRLWWVDTRKIHSAMNAGEELRVHLVASIIVDENKPFP